jgi:hypothetical protein
MLRYQQQLQQPPAPSPPPSPNANQNILDVYPQLQQYVGSAEDYARSSPSSPAGLLSPIVRSMQRGLSYWFGPNALSGDLNLHPKTPEERRAMYDAMTSQVLGLGGPLAIVSHGTPASPESFAQGLQPLSNLRKGTGGIREGAGTYFAEAPGVGFRYAEGFAADGSKWSFRNTETGAPITLSNSAHDILLDFVNIHGGNKEAIFNEVHDQREYYRQWFKQQEERRSTPPLFLGAPAQMEDFTKARVAILDELLPVLSNPETEIVHTRGPAYIITADIPDEHIDNMLDLYEPLSNQPDVVKKLVDAKLLNPLSDMSLMTGADYYSMLSQRLDASYGYTADSQTRGKIRASEALYAAGIPGNKYLDQFSRGVSPSKWQLQVGGKPATLSPGADETLEQLMMRGYTTKEALLKEVTGRLDAFSKFNEPQLQFIDDLPWEELYNHLKNPEAKLVDMSKQGKTYNIVVFHRDVADELQHNGKTIWTREGVKSKGPHSAYHWANPQGAYIDDLQGGRYSPYVPTEKPYALRGPDGSVLSTHQSRQEAQEAQGQYALRLLQSRPTNK